MSKLARQSYSISIIVATSVISIQNIIIRDFDLFKTHSSVIFFTAGLSAIFYRIILQIYENRGWRWLNPEFVIAGNWKHKLEPSNQDANGDREGTFTVEQTIFETKFVGGKNIDENTNRDSHWRSLAVAHELDGRNLWMIYEIERTRPDLVAKESRIDRGIIKVYLDVESTTKEVRRMSGQYWDAGNSHHHGIFSAERSPSSSRLWSRIRNFIYRF